MSAPEGVSLDELDPQVQLLVTEFQAAVAQFIKGFSLLGRQFGVFRPFKPDETTEELFPRANGTKKSKEDKKDEKKGGSIKKVNGGRVEKRDKTPRKDKTKIVVVPSTPRRIRCRPSLEKIGPDERFLLDMVLPRYAVDLSGSGKAKALSASLREFAGLPQMCQWSVSPTLYNTAVEEWIQRNSVDEDDDSGSPNGDRYEDPDEDEDEVKDLEG